MEQSLQLIETVLDRLFVYGPIWIYLVLFLSSFIENIFPPYPGDFVTITGGALAAAGRLNIFAVFVLAYAGGIMSVMVLYYLGKRHGRSFFIRKNYRYLSADDVRRMENWFERRGALLLLFNRFIVGARAVVALVAGISRYRVGGMFLYTSISFWMFNGLLLFSSYVFVVNFETITQYYKMYEKIAWPIILALVIAIAVWKITKSRRHGK